MKLALTPRAGQDIDEIFDFTAGTWGVEQAEAYIHGLRASLERLTRFPQLGRPIEDIRPGMRLMNTGSHIVIYRIGDDTIEVIRILHKRMDTERHL